MPLQSGRWFLGAAMLLAPNTILAVVEDAQTGTAEGDYDLGPAGRARRLESCHTEFTLSGTPETLGTLSPGRINGRYFLDENRTSNGRPVWTQEGGGYVAFAVDQGENMWVITGAPDDFPPVCYAEHAGDCVWGSRSSVNDYNWFCNAGFNYRPNQPLLFSDLSSPTLVSPSPAPTSTTTTTTTTIVTTTTSTTTIVTTTTADEIDTTSGVSALGSSIAVATMTIGSLIAF